MTGLSIIMASSGRPSLHRVLDLIVRQMQPGDELLLDVNEDAPFGNAARNRLMPRARSGNGLVFFDDDDQILPGGLHYMRSAYLHAPDRMHIFKMRFRASVLWHVPRVLHSNVSTQMICVPRSWALYGKWGERYEGDFDFIRSLAERFGEDSIVWHEDLVVIHNGLRGSESPPEAIPAGQRPVA